MTLNASLLSIIFLIALTFRCVRTFNTSLSLTSAQLYLNFKPTDVSLDYQLNDSEEKATEPPELDPNSELVDESGMKVEPNGYVEPGKIKDNKEDLIQPQTRSLKVNDKPMNRIKTRTTKAIGKDNNFCLEGPDSGYWCDGEVGNIHLRYYYQKESYKCECFLYYGCDGNRNNFKSTEDCKVKCSRFGYVSQEMSFNTKNCQFYP